MGKKLYMFVSTVKISVSTLVGVFVGTLWCFLHKKPQPSWGFPVDIFVHTPVCIFVCIFVREFVGQISRVGTLCAFLQAL